MAIFQLCHLLPAKSRQTNNHALTKMHEKHKLSMQRGPKEDGRGVGSPQWGAFLGVSAMRVRLEELPL